MCPFPCDITHACEIFILMQDSYGAREPGPSSGADQIEGCRTTGYCTGEYQVSDCMFSPDPLSMVPLPEYLQHIYCTIPSICLWRILHTGILNSELHSLLSCRAAGALMGEGISNFITDWDKVSATVSLCTHVCEVYDHQYSLRVCMTVNMILRVIIR